MTIKHKTPTETIAARFNKNAHHYEQFAKVQMEMGKRLIDRLDYIKINPNTICDLGGATGYLTRELYKKYPKAQFINLDIAENFLHIAKKKKPWRMKQTLICAAMENMPIETSSVDLIIANLSIHWSQDINKTFAQCFRILKPNGLLLCTLPGPDTLKEIRTAFAKVEPEENTQHVNKFLDMHDTGDLLLQAGFQDPVVDMQMCKANYSTIKSMLDDIRCIGANTILNQNKSGLYGKSKWRKFIKAMEDSQNLNTENLDDKRYICTYETVFATAWRPDINKSNQPQNSGNEVRIPISNIGRKQKK